MGRQTYGRSWTVKITNGGGQYSVNCPYLNCGGNPVSVSGSFNTMLFKERLMYGKDKCVDVGRMELVKSNDSKIVLRGITQVGARE